MKITCPVCGKLVSGYVPKGGDGSALRPYRHGDCEGRFHDVDLSEAHLTQREPDDGDSPVETELSNDELDTDYQLWSNM